MPCLLPHFRLTWLTTSVYVHQTFSSAFMNETIIYFYGFMLMWSTIIQHGVSVAGQFNWFWLLDVCSDLNLTVPLLPTFVRDQWQGFKLQVSLLGVKIFLSHTPPSIMSPLPFFLVQLPPHSFHLTYSTAKLKWLNLYCWNWQGSAFEAWIWPHLLTWPCIF